MFYANPVNSDACKACTNCLAPQVSAGCLQCQTAACEAARGQIPGGCDVDCSRAAPEARGWGPLCLALLALLAVGLGL